MPIERTATPFDDKIYSSEWRSWHDPEIPEAVDPLEVLLGRHLSGPARNKPALIADGAAVTYGPGDSVTNSVNVRTGSTLTLAGLFAFRKFMAERSIYYVVGFLTIVGTVLSLPQVGMYYGLHEWTAARTGGSTSGQCASISRSNVAAVKTNMPEFHR